MAYKVIILYRLYMPSYFLGTFTEYPFLSNKKRYGTLMESSVSCIRFCLTFLDGGELLQQFFYFCRNSTSFGKSGQFFAGNTHNFSHILSASCTNTCNDFFQFSFQFFS